MNVLDLIWSQSYPEVLIGLWVDRVEALVAPLNSPDLLDLIVEMQRHHYLSNHYVETWTEATASDDGSSDLSRVEEDKLAGASLEELQRLHCLPHVFLV